MWIIGRTQTNGVADYPAVHDVHDGYSITPLGGEPEHVIDADYDVKTEPLKIVNDMAALDYPAYSARLLSGVNTGLLAAISDSATPRVTV